jgi:hypothetical protein
MTPRQKPKWRRRLITGLATSAAIAMAVGGLYAPWLSQWGSTALERRSPVTGDELVDADLTWTRSITIDVRPEAVWPWLVQMGVDRGGFYNFVWGEQLFGDPVHNATTIRPAWQDLGVGDAIHPFPGQDWTVEVLVSNRVLVLTNAAATPTDWSWATELRALRDSRRDSHPQPEGELLQLRPRPAGPDPVPAPPHRARTAGGKDAARDAGHRTG